MQKHQKALAAIKLSKDDTMRDRVLEELLCKRVKGYSKETFVIKTPGGEGEEEVVNPDYAK